MSRVFAVDAGTGHLTEIRSCQGRVPSLGPAVEVDSADWRTCSAIFGVFYGHAAILYAVTPTGELWWRRQEAPGVAPGTPVRVADWMSWRHDVVFAAGPGYLALGDYDGPMQIFRHDGWAWGGMEVYGEGRLFTRFHGPRITAVVPGSDRAVGTWGQRSYCVWRNQDPSGTEHDDTWYTNGLLPAGVSGVTVDGARFYGVDFGGNVVMLRAQQSAVCTAPLHSTAPWTVTARLPGHFNRVLVPMGNPAIPPPVGPLPPPSLGSPSCNPPTPCEKPWEWQAI
jgi:hypothetical protein